MRAPLSFRMKKIEVEVENLEMVKEAVEAGADIIMLDNMSTEEMQEAMEKLYYSFEERKRRGEAAYRWLCTKGCRIEDKVDWLEKELLALRERRKEVGEN